MAETGGKKGKKKKGKTVNLVEFLQTDNQNSTASLGPVFNTKSSSWADETEDLPTEVDSQWPEESYGGVSSSKRQMNLAALPTAPRASMQVEIDYSKIPEQPPFTAFLGNLPYDVDKVDIINFFKDIKLTEVRLPQDTGGGRAKGFGYAEFEDKESLIQALSMNNETLRGRKLRIDIAGQNQGGGDRDRSDRDDGPDMTMGDWRAMPDDPPSRPSNRFGSSNGYQDRYSRDGSRFDRRDDGRWGRDSERGRYNDYDDQRYPDRYDERRPRDHYDYNHYGDRYDSHRYGDSYQRDSWGSRYGERDRRDGRGGHDTSDPYNGEEFTRDQARPPAPTRGPSSQNEDGQNDNYSDCPKDTFGEQDDRESGDRGGRGYGDRDRGYGDRDRGYGDRDRGYGDRGYGDRDRGYGDRDRGYGDRDRGYGDRGYGDRDRGYGDRGYGDRDRGYADRERRYDDRDRGYGDRDRGYSDRDRRYGDRDGRYGDRNRSYGDRDRGYGDRDRGYGDRGRDFGDRHDYGSRGSQDDPEPVRERPKLQLKPRTKPVEESTTAPAESRSSIFGNAKPVDTAAKEREIEQKLEKLKVEKEPESPKGAPHSNEGEFRSRRDSGRTSDGDRPSSTRARRDSEKSLEKEGTAANKHVAQDAPPPTVNVWKQRMSAQKSGLSEKGTEASESNIEKPGAERTVEKKVMSPNGPTSPGGRGSNPRQQTRGSERGGGATRGRSRGRGEHHTRSNEAVDGKNKEERRERRERRAPELKKVDDQPPVFHQTSKFSALLMDADDEEEEDTAESAET